MNCHRCNGTGSIKVSYGNDYTMAPCPDCLGEGKDTESPPDCQDCLPNCHDCDAKPGQVHQDGCDTERCSACGGQRLSCDCGGPHDKAFARWTGIWPGEAEADYLGIDLNEFSEKYDKLFFIKPKETKP